MSSGEPELLIYDLQKESVTTQSTILLYLEGHTDTYICLLANLLHRRRSWRLNLENCRFPTP